MLLFDQKEAAAPEAAAPEVAAPVIWPGILPGIIDTRYRCHRVYAAIQSEGSRSSGSRCTCDLTWHTARNNWYTLPLSLHVCCYPIKGSRSSRSRCTCDLTWHTARNNWCTLPLSPRVCCYPFKRWPGMSCPPLSYWHGCQLNMLPFIFFTILLFFFITKSRARLLCFFCFLKMKKYPVASRYFFS